MKRRSWELLGSGKPASEWGIWAENGVAVIGCGGSLRAGGGSGSSRGQSEGAEGQWRVGARGARRAEGRGAGAAGAIRGASGGRSQARGHAREIGVPCSAVRQPAGRSLRVRRAVGEGRAEAPAKGRGALHPRPRASAARSGDNGRGQCRGEAAVQLERRRGPPRGPGSGRSERGRAPSTASRRLEGAEEGRGGRRGPALVLSPGQVLQDLLLNDPGHTGAVPAWKAGGQLGPPQP